MKQLLFAAAASTGIAVLLLNAGIGSQTREQNWRNQGVLYLDHSLNARLHPVPIQAVHLGDGFWSARRRVTTVTGIPPIGCS